MRTIGRYNIVEKHIMEDKQNIALLYNRYAGTWWIAFGITDECILDSNGTLIPVTTHGMVSYSNKYKAYEGWNLYKEYYN